MGKSNTFKRIMFVLVTVFILNFTVISIYAETKNIDANLYGNVSTLTGGQELQVTLKLDQYKNIGKGLNAYKAKLEYDKNVFENVSKNNFLSLNNWEMLEFNEKTGEFVAIKKSGSKKPEEVVKIRLKTKNNIKDGKSTVKVKEIVTSEGKKDLFADDESISINLVGNNTNPSVPVVPNQPTETTKPTESTVLGSQASSKNKTDSINKSSNALEADIVDSESTDNTKDSNESLDDSTDSKNDKNSKKSSSKSSKEEKKSTSKNYLFIFLVIIGGIGFLIFFIIKDNDDDDYENRKNNKKKTRKTIAFIFIGILSLQFISTAKAAFYDFSKKGEVNGDNKVNYDDVKCLENHLINSKKIESIYLENADINNDDSITVTDLTLLVQKLEKTLDYEVDFSKLEQESKYVYKNADVSLVFKADVSYGAKIKKVKINDAYYDVAEDSLEEGKYKVIVPASDKAGVKEYNFTEVLLNNDKKIKVDFTESIEVLKTKPVIKNYVTTEDFSNSTINISFDLDDEDGSTITSNIQVIDESGKVIKELNIKNGYNKFKVNVEAGKIYKAKFMLNYNLTSDKEISDSTGNLAGTISFEKELQLIVDYNFNAGNFATAGTTFGREEDIKIFFDSTNATNYVPERVKINGKTYNVTIENNKYTVIIPGFDKFGNNTINIESVTLNNGKIFDIKDNNKLVVNIIKSAPSISDFVIEENTEKDVIDVKFKVNNEDDSLLGMVINLTDENDTLIEQIKLSKEEINGTNNISKSLKNASQVSKYKVSVVASYNQTGKDEDLKENVVLMQKEFAVAYKAVIKESTSNKSYYEKGEDVLLTYDIVTNSTKNITKIRINNRDYTAEKLSDGRYRVVYKAFTKSGIETLSTTKVICEDGTLADVLDTRKIEVLKDAPKISDFKQADDTKNSKTTVSFNLDDSDNSFISGKAVLTNTSDNTTVTKEIKNGKNSIEFEVKALKSYVLNVKVTYNRDSNNDSINKVTDQTLFTKEITGGSDYNLTISNIKTIKNNIETKYFDKNEAINIDFESTNVSNYDISEVTVNGSKYSVMKEGNIYRAILNGYSKAGVQTLTIEKVKLSNSKELEVKSNNKVQIEVLKDAPKISNYKQTDDEKNYKTTISFDLDDNDNSFISGNVILTNKNDGKVVTKAVKNGKNDFEFDIKAFNSYTLNIDVTYDRDSKVDSTNNFTNQTLLTKEIIGSSDYNLTISNIKTIKNNIETKYFDKNNVSGYDISEVTVNGSKYSVTKVGNIYRAILSGYSKTGSQTLTIEKVKLSNSKELEVNSNNKVQIEVLKVKPTINNYKVLEDINESSLTISFDLVDADNSITDSSVSFLNADSEVIKTITPTKGANTVKLSVEDGKKYKVKFNIKYNLTSEDKPSDTNVFGTISVEKDLQLNINYNFVANNFKTFNEKNEETTLFNKGQDIKIMFNSSNATNHEVSKIRINGKDYDVKKENNKYAVSILGLTKFGVNTLKIDKVTLDNGKTFDVSEALNVTIIKDFPVVNNLNVVEDSKNDHVNVDFTIKDDDKALLEIIVRLFNDKGSVLEEIKLTDKEITDGGKISKIFNSNFTSKYKVSVVGSYLQTGNANDIKKDVLLSEKEIEAEAKAIITGSTSDKVYYEKGSNAILTYSINTNKTDDITKITINDKDYDATKLSDGKYQVVYKNATTSGVKSLKTTKLTYKNGQTVTADTTVKIEVLKDIPTVSGFKQSDNVNDSKIVLDFNLNDNDSSFISGEAILQNVADSSIVTKKIKKGKNSLEFNVKELEMYTFKINATYDRDTNVLTTTDNMISNKTISTHNIQLVLDYNLSVSDLLTSNESVNTKYFEKNEEINLLFKSTNATKFEVVEATINGNKYEVVKNNGYYQIKVKGFSTSGVKTLTIESVKLSNTKEIDINANNKVQIEVLKDKPTVDEFKYEEDNYGNVSISFNVVDTEKVISNGKVIISNSKGNVVEQSLNISKNTVKFTPKEEDEYKIEVFANYDLDSNKLDDISNEYKNAKLLDEELKLGKRQFEVKDITGSTVYVQTTNGVKEVNSLNVSDLKNLDNYIVKVQMMEMPTFYTTIKEYIVWIRID